MGKSMIPKHTDEVRWTEESDATLVKIVEEDSGSLKSYYRAARLLKRSTEACKYRYWKIRVREKKEGENGGE